MDEDPIVVQVVRYTERCPDCGADTRCSGVQALADGRLRWDVEAACAACGFAVAACGPGQPPPERREQSLTGHGPTLLRVDGTGPAPRVAVMRVLREEMALDLEGARTAARSVPDRTYAGTRPEVERLARRLRARGIAAESVPAPEARSA
ncbi:hypothetical protein [Actinacidiphila acidipaludis]|uniref:Ribosomal protein L7/L12 C-terminal domain-containing protein n=1 Tax=Actinacidiphila acidipaludis TaxID=2873382 RepID=A0ABS7Q6R7_9ACTN|nr:hypothetical protein [Streptomyces acidipaludis]MBY8878841.1 hypothetical protein [Streptomyces acidipaludis]